VVENFVFNFINVNKNSWQKIMYWNTASGAEVDFIVQDQVNFKLIPIEAKNKDKDNF
jgi:predicted AAA+ superfamily ATPase